MLRHKLALLILLCASCRNTTIGDPDHGYFRAFPAFSDAEYAVEVARSDVGDVIVLTVLPRAGGALPSTAIRKVPRQVEQDAMNALTQMTRKPEVQFCTDATGYFVAISKNEDSSSRVSSSCSHQSQAAAASLYRVLRPLFGSMLPAQENWAEPPKQS
jgi:hypothetical protein